MTRESPLKEAFHLTLAECSILGLWAINIERYTRHMLSSISLIVFAAVVVYFLYSTFRKNIKLGIIKSVAFTGFLLGFLFTPPLIQETGGLDLPLGMLVALISSFVNISMKKNSS